MKLKNPFKWVIKNFFEGRKRRIKIEKLTVYIFNTNLEIQDNNNHFDYRIKS